MSEAPPEAPAPASPRRGGGNVFTRKIGPLPMWIWLVIVAAVILAYELYKSKSSGSSAADTTPAADVPQFVNQVYTSPNPPVAGPPVPPDPDDGGKKPPGHHKPPVAYGPERREATGRETLSQIARERHTTVAHLIAVTRTSQITPANLKRFLAAAAHPNRKLPKGLVYYTSH